jgi:hypothetical protein
MFIVSVDKVSFVSTHQVDTIETMCMLEMCFPSFFDMQQQLMINLVDQIYILGLLYLHSIFPYERYLAVLKSYVRNHVHPEGSIMEGPQQKR